MLFSYTDNPKDPTKNLWELINKFINLTGYKIIIQRSVSFLYTNNKLSEKEIKKTIPFTIASKIKSLEINLIKEVKDLYDENYKKFIKKLQKGFPGGAVVRNPPANAGDTGSSPSPGRSHMPRSSWAREPQLLSLRVWSLCSATREATIVRGLRTAMKSGPHLPQLEKALAQKRRPNTAINK